MSTESWREIYGYEGLYQVSKFGDVRRVGRAANLGGNHGGGARIGRVLKPQKNQGGYLFVQLWKNGSYKFYLVHRLVALAFLGDLRPGQEVNHKDGNKQNNSRDNLEYVTRSENSRHAYNIQLRPSGEKHPWAKLTQEQVDEIRQLHSSGLGCRRLAKRFGVSKNTVTLILNGKNWKQGADR